MTEIAPDHLDVDGVPIAFRRRAGRQPGVVWLGGYRSDMLGTKAAALDGWAEKSGHACLRHDYSGHGESGGAFTDGTISSWLAQSLAVFRRRSEGPQVLVGSSMGAWIALRLVQELAKAGESARVGGMVLIAPAPDFTAELVEPDLTKAQRRDLDKKGFFETPSEYSGEPSIFTRALIEDGRNNRVLTGPLDTFCPVHVIQGMRDPDVPYQHALKLVGLLPADDVTLSLVPDGDHRLSRPQDIEMILAAVEAMVRQAEH
ncbi:alpha/beta hydrolase [Mesorhizobium sp. LHD-90]|uniref:alpha/beta hydrolase n=1 Tax=Mesorhizobium sp. LHD-90 TaxID=3071414 RepID=UPI0027DED970|nr:alpha/beta hydrolase [Mesorhizobium sp. LHD-90]MDQ6435675.1 alpha/beta hydrolase [Mesorhizobium sp. LHD-90]